MTFPVESCLFLLLLTFWHKGYFIFQLINTLPKKNFHIFVISQLGMTSEIKKSLNYEKLKQFK